MKKYILILFHLVLTTAAFGQHHEILSPAIASLQVMAGDDWRNLPVASLRSSTPICISFDDLTHEYRRYTYKVEHCEADWTVSEGLFDSDYCQGFATGNTIDDYEQSEGTYQLYTHYTIEIPNDRCRLTMSGNYRLTIYADDDEEAPVLRACFMMLEPQTTVGMEVLTNTDIDFNHSHQQIAMTLNYGTLRVTDPQRQLKTVVLQNGRWSSAVHNPKAQFIKGDGMQWSHCRDLIFEAGNVYRKFEMLDVTHTTMGMETIGWDGEQYHAWVWIDEPRPNYVTDESGQGSFLIRNSDNEGNGTESEYLWAHFRLRSPRLPGTVYINGAWTYGELQPQYVMTWNEQEQLYEAAFWLKQGYYSYRYVVVRPDGTIRNVPSEGSFYQTQNKYQALVYFRGDMDRADRLVGYAKIE